MKDIVVIFWVGLRLYYYSLSCGHIYIPNTWVQTIIIATTIKYRNLLIIKIKLNTNLVQNIYYYIYYTKINNGSEPVHALCTQLAELKT